MNKFNKITVCVEGKNIKVEVGTYTLRTLIIKKLNGMAAFKESKHQYKIWTISKRKNVRERLALEGKSKEEINDICNRINCFKWKLFAKRTKIDYIEGNVQFCHFLEKKYHTSYLTLKEAEKHIQEFVDDLKARNRAATLSMIIWLQFAKLLESTWVTTITLFATVFVLKMIQLNTTPNVVKKLVMLH